MLLLAGLMRQAYSPLLSWCQSDLHTAALDRDALGVSISRVPCALAKPAFFSANIDCIAILSRTTSTFNGSHGFLSLTSLLATAAVVAADSCAPLWFVQLSNSYGCQCCLRMSMADDIHPDASSSIARDGDSGPTIKLAVFCPQRPLQHGVQTADVAELYTVPEKLEVPSASTVKDLKAKLEQTFPGGPLATAQSLLWHGRRLSDDEVLQQVVQGTQQVSDST